MPKAKKLKIEPVEAQVAPTPTVTGPVVEAVGTPNVQPSVVPGAPIKKLVEKKAPVLSKSQIRMQKIRPYIVKDTDGRDMFVRSKEAYNEFILPFEQAVEYLGGRSPDLYFREGLLHEDFPKTLGNLLPEDSEEVITMRRIIPFSDFLLFKQLRSNVYVILVPKEYSSYELDADGDFNNPVVNFDLRVITFNGVNSPSAFEQSNFEQRLKKIFEQIQKVAEDRRLRYRS